ncbi:hypothetical protein [Pseudomonas fluorescens]|uniref:hypothetical protein n=1 Tax=Pseudomonas fluorescens TaxID=294 RepID=UPI001CD46E01|nr:hypothetical protein [Pseudomonas fluorescens]
MPKFILDYIWLCRECSLDRRTVGNDAIHRDPGAANPRRRDSPSGCPCCGGLP